MTDLLLNSHFVLLALQYLLLGLSLWTESCLRAKSFKHSFTNCFFRCSFSLGAEHDPESATEPAVSRQPHGLSHFSLSTESQQRSEIPARVKAALLQNLTVNTVIAVKAAGSVTARTKSRNAVWLAILASC